jgi:hypothetical protein
MKRWLRMINCTNTAELNNVGEYLHDVRCKWGNKISTMQLGIRKASVDFYSHENKVCEAKE